MAAVTCCGALEKMSVEYDLPFYRPVILADGQLGVGNWAVKCRKLTKRGNISKVGGRAVYLNYCPFCGKKLAPDDR